MQEEVLSASEFWAGWRQLLADDRFAFLAEPNSFTGVWQHLCATLRKGQCAETDLYLAALAHAANVTLVSFDQGIGRFAGPQVLVLR